MHLARFKQWDKNNDGLLDYDELLDGLLEQQMEPDEISDLFSKLDLDGDDQISLSEWEKGVDAYREAAYNARNPRFVGERGDLSLPEKFERRPVCLQGRNFKPTMTLEDELKKNGVDIQSVKRKNREVMSLWNDGETALHLYSRKRLECGYSESMYSDLNQSMYQYKHKRWENTIYHMNEIIISESKQPTKLLYRGMKTMRVKVGEQLVFKSFTSTSKDRKVAEKFMRASGGRSLLIFRTVKYAKDMNVPKGLAEVEEEKEVLLAPYQTFIVDEVKKGPEMDYIYLEAADMRS